MNSAHSEAWAAADILIVDDAAHSLRLLANLLTSAGYHVRPANGGRMALHSVQAN